MRYLVDVEGAEVAVERPWSGTPGFLIDGHELATDRWGRRVLTMADGSQEEVRVGYRALFIGPRLEVAGRHYSIGRPLPTWVLVALGAFVVLGFWGGAAGAFLAMGSRSGSCGCSSTLSAAGGTSPPRWRYPASRSSPTTDRKAVRPRHLTVVYRGRLR